jgi:hypothetical protein
VALSAALQRSALAAVKAPQLLWRSLDDLMARKFLYFIAGIIALMLAAGVAWQFYGIDMVRAVLVPSTGFTPLPARTDKDYENTGLWLARPGLKDDASLWRPKGLTATDVQNKVATFFVHPTSYLNRDAWNAPVDDADANEMARGLVSGQASAFRAQGPVWAPRYRQATFGAFMTRQAESAKAIDAAYQDVNAAFDQFLASIPADQPIIFAGHSQGTVHLLRLMKDRVAGKPIANRIVAVYLIGWPISIQADLPALGLPQCSESRKSRCILSWQSFAEPADTSTIDQGYDAVPGLTGAKRKGTPMVCTNLTGGKTQGGYLTLSLKAAPETYVDQPVKANCSPAGYLIMPSAPDVGGAVMPGNNYHVYDYALFWRAIEQDVAARVAAFTAQ